MKKSFSFLFSLLMSFGMMASAGQWNDFISSFESTGKSLWGSVSSAAESAGDDIKDKAEKIGNDIKENAEKIGNDVKENAEKIGNDVKDKAEKIGNDVKGKVEEVGGKLEDIGGTIEQKVSNLDDAFDKFSSIVENGVSSLGVDEVLEGVELLEEAVKAAEKLGDADAKKLVEEAEKVLKSAIENADISDSVKETLKDCAEALGDIDLKNIDKELSKIASELADAAEDISLDKLGDSVEKLISEVAGEDNTKAAKELIEKIKNADTDALKQEGLKALESLLEKAGVDPDVCEGIKNAADSLMKGEDISEDLLKLAKESGLSYLEDKLADCVGEKNAEKIMEYVDKIANGEFSLEDALNDGLDALLDELPTGTANGIKELVTSLAEGESLDDLLDTGKELLENVAKDAVDGALEAAGLSKEQRETVMNELDKALDGDWESILDDAKGGIQNYVGNFVTDKFGEDAGKLAKDAMGHLLNGDWKALGDTIMDGLNEAGTILQSKFEEAIDSKLQQLANKYPVLGKVFDALGISGSGIMGGLSNVWNVLKEGNLQEAMTKLMDSLVNGLTDLAGKLKDFAENIISNLANVVTKAIQGLLDDLLDKLQNGLKTALDKFVSEFEKLQTSLKSASGYFLGNESNSSATIVQMKNSLKNALKKNVFKTNGISN